MRKSPSPITNQLAAQQKALVDALLIWPPDSCSKKLADQVIDPWGRGLKAYQSNAHALAERALQAAYPVLVRLLGDESFAALARTFWHANPPVKGDLARWGDGLSDFVRTSEQLVSEPYLADVARVEWAIHASAGSADRDADPTTFKWLMTNDPDRLQMVLAPGCQVVCSAWPVASIMAAHLDGVPTFEEVGRKLKDRIAENTVIWRKGHQPQAREAVVGEAPLITALLARDSLDTALQLAHGLDFNAWLPMAVQTGLLLAVEQVV